MGDIVGDDEADKDMFEEGKEAFLMQYHLSHEKAMRLGKAYIVFLTNSCQTQDIAVATTDVDVAIYDAATLTEKRLFDHAHAESITGLAFSPRDGNVFYTCSMESTIKVWDIRSRASKPVATFSDTASTERKPFTAFDVSCDDRLFCAGTEQVKKDAFLLFWDVRKAKLMGGYWESHEDDITTVRFHPSDANRLASSGTDGIVNVFNVSEETEDDALDTCMNTESSIQKLRWYPNKKGQVQNLACVTHTEELHLWDTLEQAGETRQLFNRVDVCVGMRRNATDKAYIVDTLSVETPSSTSSLMVLCGSWCEKNPCLRLAQVKKSRLRPYADLIGSTKFSSVTRCMAELSVDSTKPGHSLVTGGEDGILRIWRQGPDSDKGAATKGSELKIITKTKTKVSPY